MRQQKASNEEQQQALFFAFTLHSHIIETPFASS